MLDTGKGLVNNYSDFSFEVHYKDDYKTVNKPLYKTKKGVQLDTSATSKGLPNFANIFVLILVIVLISMCFRVLQDKTIPTFESLLNMLANAKNFQFDFLIINTTTLPNWLAFLGEIWNVLVFMAQGIFALFNYVMQFVRWLLF